MNAQPTAESNNEPSLLRVLGPGTAVAMVVGNVIGGGIFFNLTEDFALGLGASTDDDVTSFGVNARYYFGN